MFQINTFFLLLVSTHYVHNKLIETAEDVELSPPWIVTYRYVNENYEVICRCYKPYTTLEWIKKSNPPIRISATGGRISSKQNPEGIILKFQNITEDAEGTYECVATDGNENYTNRFMLNVADPVVFDSPTYYEAVLNENIFLQCKVNQKLIPDREWEFRGNILLTEEHFQYDMEGILISNVGLHDAGKYYCIVSHSPFQTNSNKLEITLVVYYKPVPLHVNSTIYGFLNEVTTVSCQVNANPSAWFIWYSKYEKPITPRNDNISIINENNTSFLKVYLTEYRSEDKFICEACNELGCAEQTIVVKSTVKLKTPAIGLWDIDSDSAEFYVSTQQEASFYTFQYYFDVDDDEKWDKAFVLNISYGSPKPSLGSYIKYEINNLHPDTKYIFRVASANNYIISDYSVERRFKTRLGMTIHTFCNSSDCLKNHFILLLLLCLYFL